MRKKIFTLDTELNFGQYKGKELWEVLRDDLNYVAWCLETVNWFELDNEAFEEYRKKSSSNYR